MKYIIILVLFISCSYAKDNYYYKNNQKVTLVPETILSRSSLHVDYYLNEKGIKLGVIDRLIVKVKNTNNLNLYLNEFNLTVEKTLSKNLYLLKIEDKNLTIDISNRLSEKEDVKYAHPDFLKKRVAR